MSNSAGYFSVDRGIWDHHLFAGEPEPFSKREAWLWLISHAEWRPTRQRIKGKTFELDRGQTLVSFRKLATLWRWSEGRVRRYFDSLKFEAMIDTAADALATRVTICNYDEYQASRRADEHANGAPSDAVATQSPIQVVDPAREISTKEVEEDKKERKEDGGGHAREPELEILPPPKAPPEPGSWPSAIALFDAICTECFGDPKNTPEAFCGGARRIRDAWFPKGWTADDVLPVVRETLRRKRDGPPESVNYFEKAISRDIAKRCAPIPEITIDGGQNGRQSAQNGRFASNRQPGISEKLRAVAAELEARQMASRSRGSSDGGASDPRGSGPLLLVPQREAPGRSRLFQESD